MKNIEDLKKLVGKETISFAVSPHTKYLLQLGAKKEGVTFSEFCRRVIEGNLSEIKTRTKANDTKEEQKKEDQ